MDSDHSYHITPGSWNDAYVSELDIDGTCTEDISLFKDEAAESSKFRKVIRPTLLRNHPHNPDARVKLSVMYRRRHNGDPDWCEDDIFFNPSALKGGEEIRINLGFRDTLLLYKHLRRLYAIGEHEIPDESCELRVVDASQSLVVEGKERETLERLLHEPGVDVWSILSELQPDTLEQYGRAQVHFARERAAKEFADQMGLVGMGLCGWKEREWDGFFRANKWIFGHGLCYRFLSELDDHSYVGGKDYADQGGRYSDGMMATGGDARFTVMVEIKRPDTPLVGREYRTGVYSLSEELSGAVAQLQGLCHSWDRFSQEPQNERKLRAQSIYTCQPKGILVVGNTADLVNGSDVNDGKLGSFERFRMSLHNPEIITFDELLARASFIANLKNEAQ